MKVKILLIPTRMKFVHRNFPRVSTTGTTVFVKSVRLRQYTGHFERTESEEVSSTEGKNLDAVPYIPCGNPLSIQR